MTVFYNGIINHIFTAVNDYLSLILLSKDLLPRDPKRCLAFAMYFTLLVMIIIIDKILLPRSRNR